MNLEVSLWNQHPFKWLERPLNECQIRANYFFFEILDYFPVFCYFKYNISNITSTEKYILNVLTFILYTILTFSEFIFIFFWWSSLKEKVKEKNNEWNVKAYIAKSWKALLKWNKNIVVGRKEQITDTH